MEPAFSREIFEKYWDFPNAPTEHSRCGIFLFTSRTWKVQWRTCLWADGRHHYIFQLYKTAEYNTILTELERMDPDSRRTGRAAIAAHPVAPRTGLSRDKRYSQI